MSVSCDQNTKCCHVISVRIKRRLMRALPEFNNLCAFVLDACVFNLIEEVRFGTPWNGLY